MAYILQTMSFRNIAKVQIQAIIVPVLRKEMFVWSIGLSDKHK